MWNRRKFRKASIGTKLIYAIKIACAGLIFVFCKPERKNGKYWIFGLGDDIYANNGKTFFEFIKKEHPEIKLFWVCDEECKIDLEKNISRENIIVRRSIKNYVYAMDAQVGVYGFSDWDIAPGLYRVLRKRKTLLVNVSHGFDGLKGMPENYYTPLPADIICAASSYEMKMKIEKCGANPEIVRLTGFARYDEWPSTKEKSDVRKIFIMPTWRGWYEDEKIEWKESDLYKAYMPVLKHMEKLAEVENVTVKCKFHPRMEMYFQKSGWGDFKNINTLDNSQSIKDALIEADLLITDYSSVLWDFLYMNKRALLYWFDEREYKDKRGLLVDRSFYPYIFESSDVLIEAVDRELHSSNEKIQAKKYFDWKDHNNCARIYNEIEKEIYSRQATI